MMKTEKSILILGASVMQGKAIEAAKELNCRVIAVDGNPNAVCANLADKFFPIDLKDIPKLIELAKKLKAEDGLDGVFTAATDFSVSVASVAQECKFSGHSLKAAQCASDKIKMRSCFKNANVPSPEFAEIKKEEIQNAAEILKKANVQFPVAVKPADNMGARGCRLVYAEDGLIPAAEDAVKYSRSGKVIAEEFIDGEEFSLEALVYNSEIFVTAIADRHIFFPPYFIEMGHTIPSAHSEEETEELIRVFKLGIKALNLTHGAAKGDIFLRKKDKKTGKRYACVGEIAARLSGGYMSGWTVPYSSTFNVTRAAIRLALGEFPEELKKGSPFLIVPVKENIQAINEAKILYKAAVENTSAKPVNSGKEKSENLSLSEKDFTDKKQVKAGFSAERAWISSPGKIKKIYGLNDALKTEGVRDVLPRLFEGDETVFPRNNVEKCGNVLSSAFSYDEAVKASMSAIQKIVLRLEPKNEKTDLFLSSINTSVKTQNIYAPNFFIFPDGFAKEYKGNFEKALSASFLKEENGIFFPSCFEQYTDLSFDIHGLSIRKALELGFEIEPALSSYIKGLQNGKKTLSAQSVKLWLAFIRASVQGLLYMYDCL
ncbi:ATP-grasp domain-containing protein [Treponema pedis]|uniref:ATP-grasp domain-containing protein n=1 Tax=Treponema pedis TaxID=409322 RepID=UPI000493ED05|nr:ATP-grasp domain-containing protein [Treponema pedis]